MPMITPEVEAALNDQLNAEFFSSYLYLSMAAYFEENDLPGMSNWMRIQADEEHQHGMKFYQFVLDRDGRVVLGAIAKPTDTWDSPLAAFEDAFEHESEVSQRINTLVDLCLKNHDHATNNFLQWFVAEQVEEEATVRDLLRRVKLVGNDGRGLFLIDQELAGRTPASADSPGA